MSTTTTVTVVEIDVPTCALTYGVAPCEAALGVTGTRKCFNTLHTCQDKDNFTPTTLTLRFFRPSGERELFDGFAVLRDVSVTPQVLDPANSIGQRESVRVLLDDFQHSDAGVDPYVADRGYDPYPRGTFWGRFRARVPSLKGAALRVMRGESGQDLAVFKVWHYIIETTAGPSSGSFSITAKDGLKLADGDRAQAPRPSTGTLLSALAAGAGSATLDPAGVGDLEYPASGKVAIGGNEIADFTRAGDVLTFTDRGANNTEDTDHDAGERVQLVLEFNARRPDSIIAELLLNYSDTDPAWINTAAWQAEVEAFTPRLYSALIAEPTPVKKLVNEVVAQIGLVLWFDTLNELIQLRALRAVGNDAPLLSEDRIIAGTFSSMEQLDKRVSQSWTYYGLKNPLEDVEDPKNYAAIAVGVDSTGADEEYNGEAIRTTYSRWISIFNRQAAERLNEVLLTRYRDPPRRIKGTLYVTDTPPAVGLGVYVQHFELQDDIGDEVQVPVQVVSSDASEDRTALVLEEQPALAADTVTEEKTIYIDGDAFNINLRDVFDTLYLAPNSYDVVTFIVGAGVKIGTQKGGNTYAISSGNWPELAEPPTLVIYGRVMGRGGDGGNGYWEGTPIEDWHPEGDPGENALLVTWPLKVNNAGTIGGGGGGGGRGFNWTSSSGKQRGGGGGQGYENSLGGQMEGPYDGGDGTPDAPGVADKGGTWPAGDGGALGENGEDGAYPGGVTGIAVRGEELIDWQAEGTILGPRLNTGDPYP